MSPALPHNRFALCIFFILLAPTTQAVFAENWLTWRGNDGLGTSLETGLPTEWGPDQNVLWRVDLPEPGNSTPIVWGDRLFLTQPIGEGKRRTVFCFDPSTGNEIWRSGVDYSLPEATHATNPFCSPSPVTDGEKVYAWFGSAGMVCFDWEGEIVWHRDLGKQDHIWGTGASPVLWRNLLIQNFGPGNREFLIALDKDTGETVWQNPAPYSAEYQGKDRSEQLHGSWSTPILIDNDSRSELIVHWPHFLVSYDPATGKEIWRCGGLGDLAYAVPMWGEGILLCMGGYHGPTIATRPGGQGDITQTHRLWREDRSRLRLGAGVIKNGYAFIHDMQGIAECIDLETGKEVWKERLEGPGASRDSWSSMVLSGDLIYLPNKSGDTFVFKAAPDFELVSTNSLGEPTNSSVTVSGGRLFLRTHKGLWCIGTSSPSFGHQINGENP